MSGASEQPLEDSSLLGPVELHFTNRYVVTPTTTVEPPILQTLTFESELC